MTIEWVTETPPPLTYADILDLEGIIISRSKKIGPIYISLSLFPGTMRRMFLRDRKQYKQFSPKRHTRMAGK